MTDYLEIPTTPRQLATRTARKPRVNCVRSEDVTPYMPVGPEIPAALVGESEAAILAAAADILLRRMTDRENWKPLNSPRDTREFLRAKLSGLEHEVFCCLYLDNRHRVIAFEEVFRGTIDGTAVYPREIVKRALHHNAAAVILCHNHPSGLAEPSRADELLTVRLKEALALIDIRVLDHLVVGDIVVSFAERGLI
jgi:DNA repair protein RadC